MSHLHSAAAILLAVSLAACQQESTAAQAGEAAREAAPETKPGLALENGRLVLPAVPGRPGAVYFTLTNGGDKPVTLAGVHVEGAGNAEMHVTTGGRMSPIGKLDIAPGGTAEFAPGGQHVMVFDLGSHLGAGGTTEVTLTFSDGDKLSAPVAIEARSGGDDMAGMDHGELH